MTHPRKTIRAAIKTLLDDGTIVASGKVYTNRSISVTDENLPILNIVQAPENSARYEYATEGLDRSFQLLIEAVNKSDDWDAVDDDLDDLAEKIEDILKENSSAGGAHDIVLTQTVPSSEADGGAPIGRVVLTYTVQYLDIEE